MNFTLLYNSTNSKNSVRRAERLAAQVTKQEASAATLSDRELRECFLALADARSEERVVRGFGLVREASRRTLGLRHFDVQVIGGSLLLEGKLAEMRTGEGKTLTVVLCAAILALEGKGVHVVTANSYLAHRDATMLAPLYQALGLSVGAIGAEQTIEQKKAAYACDVTYGVGSEFGFDYLKDHLVRHSSVKVQRGLHAAIVDEADSVLIDDARAPLTISDVAGHDSDLVVMLNAVVRDLVADVHFSVNAKERSADLTDAGYAAVEASLVASGKLTRASELYDPQHLNWVRKLHSAVRAYALFRKGRDYVVLGQDVVLIDQGTGRKVEGSRLGDGMHEALEAREGLPIRPGMATKATITFQGFFGLYERLAGLTGTAMTEADEFAEIYRLEVVEVPTNRPLIRTQLNDLVFLTKSTKFAAAADEISARHRKGQPVLVGCSSVRDAEVMSRLLAAKGIEHGTLTATHVENEAHVIAGAGRKGAVTVATYMAGRGTDILLGGAQPCRTDFETTTEYDEAFLSWEREQELVISLGGLFILGTERNGLRRLDNQLAGRCGRQGNPGEIQFMLSLEDELLRVFGQSAQLALLRQAVAQSGSALGGPVVSQLVAAAQKNVESAGFAARKGLMRFDSVFAEQRQVVFTLRDQLLEHGCKQFVVQSARAALKSWVDEHMPSEDMVENWNAGALKKRLREQFGLNLPILGWVNREELDAPEIRNRVLAAAEKEISGSPMLEDRYAVVAFDALDECWTEHLHALNELRENLSLKAHGGVNVVWQFKSDSFGLFKAFEVALEYACAAALLKPAVASDTGRPNQAPTAETTGDQKVALALERRWIPRNSSCPCGSGTRFRLCHGRLGA